MTREDLQRLLAHHPMIDAVVEVLGETALEDRKAHARKRGQLRHALRLVVIVAHEHAEVILRLNHRLEEISMLRRRIQHLDHHEKLRSLHFVVTGALAQLRNGEQIAEQAFDRRMHRKPRHRFGRDDRIVGHHLIEDILFAELDAVNQRKHDDMGVVLRRGDETFAPRQTYVLFRRHKPHRIPMLHHQRTRHHEKNAHHAVCGKSHPFSC